MKTILSVFAMILATIIIGCKDDVPKIDLPADNDAIPLSLEFEKFLIDNKIDRDPKPDGQIRFSEIKDVDSLNIRLEGNGNSLKGLEHFTNLKYLKFTGYQLPTNETNQYYYALSSGVINAYIPSIDTLDVSKNVKLEFVECSGLGDGGGYASSVGYLKLGNNDQLKTIAARRTMMSSLDISGLPNLENLDIWSATIYRL